MEGEEENGKLGRWTSGIEQEMGFRHSKFLDLGKKYEQ